MINENIKKNVISSKEFWLSNIVYIVIGLMFIVFAMINPMFISKNNIISLFTQSCTMIIIGIGVSMCMLTRGIDLSVGSTMYISAVGMYVVMDAFENMPIGIVVLIGLAIGLGIGLINGLIVNVLKVYPLLPTLATMYAFRGIGLSIAGASVSQMPMRWSGLVSANWMGIPIYVFVAILFAIMAQIFLNKTKLGRHIYATGDNEQMAIEKGVNVFRVKLFVYMMSGMMAALAAVLSSAMTMQASYTLGEGAEFKVITAAVLGGVSLSGGRGTVAPGIIVGSLILTFISNILVLMKANPYSYNMVYALVMFAVVVLNTVKLRSEEK